MRFQTCHELLEALKNYHDLVNQDATVKMSPANTQSAMGGTRTATQASRPLTVASNARTGAVGAPVRPVPWAAEEEHEAAKKRGTFVLSVILLCIIGFAGYRIWPPLLDIWQHMQQPAGAPAIPPVAPAANTGTPDTKSDTSSQAVPPAEPTAAKEEVALQQTLVLKAPSKTPENSVESPTGFVKKQAPPQKTAGLPATPAANSLRSTLRSELADLSLSDKVKMQVTGNTLIISGQLTAREHSELLNHLHKVPAGVQVIDDIGYAGE
jgi:hypothetical protein